MSFVARKIDFEKRLFHQIAKLEKLSMQFPQEKQYVTANAGAIPIRVNDRNNVVLGYSYTEKNILRKL